MSLFHVGHLEVNVGFSRLEYEVSEDNGFLYVTFGVLSGELNRNITIDFTFNSGTAIGNINRRLQSKF